MKKTALITGVTGQDGSYLAELLLEKGYDVHGIVRRSSSFNTVRVDHLLQPAQEGSGFKLHFGDLADPNSLRVILDEVKPDEVYNLAAQSHVRVSFDMPLYTNDAVALGTLRLLDAIHKFEECSGRRVRFYQASSSEQFGKALETPQRETTPFYPRSPYACGKAFAHFTTVNYRESYGMHASCGILFNHESPRRGETFVTRKITRAVGRIKLGLQDKLYLGNLEAKRDWGYAKDYVEAMWLMLQKDEPGDYVIATGETHSVREFLELAFGSVDLDYNDYVEHDPRYYRPTEVDVLLGDARKAKRELDWAPKTTFVELVEMMVEADLDLANAEKLLADVGRTAPILVRALSRT